MVSFSCKTKIIGGDGAVLALKEMDIRRLFVVADPFFVKNGTAERIACMTGAEETGYFDGVTPDPDVRTVAEAASQMQRFRPDTVLALGGGSAMDCAKAARFFSGIGSTLVAVPTTSGSGAEVTDFAVITAGQTKYPLVDSALTPEVAILDGDLLRELPAGLIADSGYDAAAHAVEAFAALGHSPLSDSLAASALREILEKLPLSRNGMVSVRMDVHYASTMAACAFSQAGLGACHALSHSLGGAFHVPHGRLNAVLLPAVVECNSKRAPERYARLARQAGIPGASDFMALRNLKNALKELRRQLGLPETLSQAGIPVPELRSRLPGILRTACQDACAGSNPVPVTETFLREILGEVADL